MSVELSPGATLGRYRLTRSIAGGGMGSVWAAEDLRLQREVAVKALPSLLSADPAAEQRFEREARALARLRHPNVVTVFDIGTAVADGAPTMPYLVMELIEGESLDRIVARGPLDPERVCGILEQVASALAAAHGAGVVHRDLKPSNVMVGPDDHVTVLDFGLARFLQRSGRPGEDTLTTPGMVLGSCAYMAPEQARGEGVTPASDVFAVGAVAYELLSGRRAFDGATPLLVLQSVVRCDPSPLAETAPDVPCGLARVVERCLAADPAHRYPSCAELADAVRDLGETGGSAPDDRSTRPPARIGRGSRRAAIVSGMLVAIAGLAVGGAAWWFLGNRGSDVPGPVLVRELAAPSGRLADPTWAPGGGSLLVVHDRGSRSQVVEIGGDGSAWRPLVRAEAGERLRSPAVSPDGRLIALAARAAREEGWQVRVAPLAGGPPVAILDDAASCSWIGDRQLAYIRPSDGTVQLFRLGSPGPRPLDPGDPGARFARVAGGPGGKLCGVVAGAPGAVVGWSGVDHPARPLYVATDDVRGAAWRPDGAGAFVADGDRLVEVGLDGERREWLVVPGLRQVAVSPDGTSVAAVVAGGWSDVVGAAPGRDAPVVVASAVSATGDIEIAADGTVAFERTVAGRSRWWIRAPGRRDRPASCGAGRVLTVVPESGSGRVACVVETGGGLELRLASVGDGVATTLAVDVASSAPPAFSPDGSLVAVVRGDPPAVELVGTAGGESRRVLEASAVGLGFAASGEWLLARVPQRHEGERPGVWAVPVGARGWPRLLTDRSEPVAWGPSGDVVWQLRVTEGDPELWEADLDGPWRRRSTVAGWWPEEAVVAAGIVAVGSSGEGLLVVRPAGGDRLVVASRSGSGGVLD